MSEKSALEYYAKNGKSLDGLFVIFLDFDKDKAIFVGGKTEDAFIRRRINKYDYKVVQKEDHVQWIEIQISRLAKVLEPALFQEHLKVGELIQVFA